MKNPKLVPVLSLVLLGGLILTTPPVQAAPVAVLNPSFEVDALAEPGGDGVGSITGWAKSGTSGGWGRTAKNQFTSGVPHGLNFAWTNFADTKHTQILATVLRPDTTYTLTVAIGWRKDLAADPSYPNFPGYGIELWAGATKLASKYHTDLDALSPAADSWIHVTATYVSPSSVTSDPLEIRLVGGANVNNGYAIQTNFDHVRLDAVTAGGVTFSEWIADYDVGGQNALGDDADGDGIDNGVENFFGTVPNVFSSGLVAGAVSANTFTFTHPQGIPANGLNAAYQWSKDLVTFYADAATSGDNTTVNFDVQPNTPDPGTTTVVATVTGSAASKLFVNVSVTQD